MHRHGTVTLATMLLCSLFFVSASVQGLEGALKGQTVPKLCKPFDESLNREPCYQFLQLVALCCSARTHAVHVVIFCRVLVYELERFSYANESCRA